MRRATAFVVLVFTATATLAQTEPVRYTLRFPAPQTHYVEVEASYPTGGAQQIDVMMPVWAPGSYLVREFARNVENVSAPSVEKTRKNRWRVGTGGAARVTFRYRVYGREMRVQTNFIDSDFAMINGAATFIAPVDRLRSPFEVTIELPGAWSKSLSSMAVIAPNRFRAADFDELVDSPIIAGNPAIHEFSVGGKPHYLVNVGDEAFWDAKRATEDVQKIVEQHRKVWGLLPYDRYYFFNLIVDAGGGLEHKGSTVLMTRRFQMRTRKSYLDWLDLVSHEQFHAWNVKRLRPVALGPFDYENENYTTNLWVSEGFTDYYGRLQVARAGLMTADEYLDRLSDTIKMLQTTPGRLVQPVAMASYDAWIKSYRPDENTGNTAISYYTKGDIIGFVLDAKIRKAAGEARSLDDVMRTAYQRYAGPRGFTTEQFIDVVREIGSADVAKWLDRTVRTTEELDYADALSWYGLEFKADPSKKKDEPKGYLGMTAQQDNSGRLVVTRVPRGTPAFDAGVNVDDEIIALDDYRVPPDALESRLEQYRPGDAATLMIARRGKVRTVQVKFATEPENVWKLKRVDKPSSEQTRHFESWLASPT